MDKLVTEAFAKINLGLSVTGRRPDGYHDIRTLMHTVTLSDTLTIERSARTEVVCGEVPQEKNIVTGALELMREETGVTGNLRAVIEKRIPMQAGLGGGSADAAAAMTAFCRLYGLEIPAERLEALGARIGADVPFLIRGGLALCEGIGDRLTALPPLAGMHAVIIKPDAGIDTGRAYAFTDGMEKKESFDPASALAALRRGERTELPNDFEEYMYLMFPETAGIKEALYSAGALGAGLTGSGACFYGIFADGEAAKAAEETLAGRFGRLFRAALTGPKEI